VSQPRVQIRGVRRWGLGSERWLSPLPLGHHGATPGRFRHPGCLTRGVVNPRRAVPTPHGDRCLRFSLGCSEGGGADRPLLHDALLASSRSVCPVLWVAGPTPAAEPAAVLLQVIMAVVRMSGELEGGA